MTKEELIEKWRAKQIAIKNDDVYVFRKVIKMLGGKLEPSAGAEYYIFCDDKYGWEVIHNKDIPKIKATKAIAILSEPKLAPKPAPDQTPLHYKALGMQPHDMLQAIHGPKALALHLRMSAFEYRMRAGYKDDPASDLDKALHCEAKAKELENAQE